MARRNAVCGLMLIAMASGAVAFALAGEGAASQPASAPASQLHNVHAVRAGRLICGAQPVGPAAFAELAAMGVRTIVSVDGVPPDVDAARAAGIRYVHVPLGYDGVPDAERLRLARATRDLPGPVFFHCHHGKHRGPAAAAATAVTLGWWSNDEAVAFLQRAGTSASYRGLYAAVAGAAVANEDELNKAGDPRGYPARAAVSELVAAMVIADDATENLKRIEAAGWTTPSDHPDLVPAAEAARLAEQFRLMAETAETKRAGDDYRQQMQAMYESGAALERSLAAAGGASRPSAKALSEQLAKIVRDCKACHDQYRR
ncbi:MAG: hypothetical protein SF069_05445 [Phycisphaerae bacterium]|nr:hypothetical protein [Phycisphaerae bacterium]